MQPSNKLLKLLGVGFGIAVTIGGTIGTGILRKPGTIAAQIGNPLIIMGIWLAISTFALFGVFCAIELSVAIPKAGSWYVYAKRAFGNYTGFLTGLTNWFGTVSAIGFGAYTMAEYIALLIPSLNNMLPVIAITIIVILTLFHFTGTKSGGRSQEILSFLKALGLLAFVFICFYYGGKIDYTSLKTTTSKIERPALFIGIISALQAVFYTFDGWHTASYFSEENTNPAKNMPKSMILGVIMIILIYLLVNAAILYVIPLDILAGSKLAASDAIQIIFGEKSAQVVTFFLMLSILGMLNAQIMFCPRGIYGMSRDGLFHPAVQRVNSVGTPSVAMPLTTGFSVILILLGQDICGILSNIAVLFFVMSYVAGFASLIKLRKTEPDLERPFKVPGYPYIPYILLIFSILFLIGSVASDMQSGQFALLLLIVSYPLYVLQTKYLK